MPASSPSLWVVCGDRTACIFIPARNFTMSSDGTFRQTNLSILTLTALSFSSGQERTCFPEETPELNSECGMCWA